MRLTVIGSGPAAPQPDTPASGLLVEGTATAVLFDCGSGVIAGLRRIADPTALSGVVIGHLHADHFVDLAALRYLLPWPGTSSGRPAIWLPPGGAARIGALAAVVSERPTFFEDAFDVHEYATDLPFRIGDVTIRPAPMQHYVPAWAMRIEDRVGRSLVYGGDGGPTDELVGYATGADVLVAEATLASAADDEPRRGHSTAAESIDIAVRAGVGTLVLTHYPSALRPTLRQLAQTTPELHVEVARPGLVVEIDRQPAEAPGSGREPASAGPLGGAGSSPSTRARIAAAPGSGPSNRSATRK